MTTRMSPLGQSQNPLIQGLSLLLGAVLLIGVVVLGAFLLAIAIGIGLVLALVIIGRIWWLRRQLGGAGEAAAAPIGRPSRRVIEVEYTVLDGADKKD